VNFVWGKAALACYGMKARRSGGSIRGLESLGELKRNFKLISYVITISYML
jgi:hypothetical protein